MKNSLRRGVGNAGRLLVIACALGFANRSGAQDNVWTGPASGNWQDAAWSLGVLPATNQTVWITNYGWKAVEINATTAQNFPQALNVDSINISSPTNSFNSLVLNYAGAGTPLIVKTITIASNSAVSMVSSALQINSSNGSGLMVGGKFDQNDSVVAGNQINVGYIGSGIYNFNSGYFTVSQLWLGGFPTPGIFNQNGGINGFGVTHLDGGTYVLNEGFYGAMIYFNGGKFFQQGGFLATNLTLYYGTYVLGGGIHQGDTSVPTSGGWSEGSSDMLQTGGTNYGALDIGSLGNGRYTLSNGVSTASSLAVGYKGTYSQWSGTQTVAGDITVREGPIAANYYSDGSFNLYGGQVSAAGLSLQGYYAQAGGTNMINGDIVMADVDCWLSLSGGLLTVSNLIEYTGWEGGVFLSGGTLVIANDLRVEGLYEPNWAGFCCGGQLVVSNIWLTPEAKFSCRDGVINQSGTLTLANANLYSGTNSVHFGPLCLANGGNTNSTLYMVSPSSVINFGDSSGVTWSNEPVLVVKGWSGSLYGGGPQQIVFGKNSSALTSAQVGRIQFHNPAGLADGTYPARILPSGEIVPASGSVLPASMALNPQPGGMQLMLSGEAGHVYSIETSTDLVHWATWTNQLNSNGTIHFTDTESKNYPVRYYRARLMP